MLKISEFVDKVHPISVIGLGYVGMPLAIAFGKHLDVIGFDINQDKINSYLNGEDVTNEVGSRALMESSVRFTADESNLINSKFHIIAVPTPINSDKTPNLTPVISASELVGRNLSKGSFVVYESTVYPGVTEDICIPILEKISGLKSGEDFWVGYSPERINPGDKVNTLEKIVKIVSGSDDYSLDFIAKIYELIIEAGVFRAESIRVAEAAKVVENSQRDINIAFMNELAIVFDKMNIDTNSVLDAMNTKWNSLGFTPGLVGGHCIGVDPYYFLYEAEKLGYHSQIIAGGRKINDSMASHVAQKVIDQLIFSDKVVSGSNVTIVGLTFKENTPDFRNSKIFDIIKILKKYNINLSFVDPMIDQNDLLNEYGFRLSTLDELSEIDCVIYAVPHDGLTELLSEKLESIYAGNQNEKNVFIDVKGELSIELQRKLVTNYWAL